MILGTNDLLNENEITILFEGHLLIHLHRHE